LDALEGRHSCRVGGFFRITGSYGGGRELRDRCISALSVIPMKL
jgi:hypothetical protein